MLWPRVGGIRGTEIGAIRVQRDSSIVEIARSRRRRLP
jgi:hypothetical protein